MNSNPKTLTWQRIAMLGVVLSLLACFGMVLKLRNTAERHRLEEELAAAKQQLAALNHIDRTKSLGRSAEFEKDRARIVDVLHLQQAAWNRGDVETFMDGYWKSEELTFSSGGKTTRSWQQTLDGYRRRYPNQAEMGELEFSELEVTPIGQDAALVLGRWRLQRAEAGNIGGNYSLVFRRFGERWLVVHDHSSKEEESSEDESKAEDEE